MRKAILFLILALTVKVYADDLIVSEYIPTSDDPYYGITVKRIMYMDAENRPVKLETGGNRTHTRAVWCFRWSKEFSRYHGWIRICQ